MVLQRGMLSCVFRLFAGMYVFLYRQYKNQAVLFQAAAQHRYGAEYILKDIEELTHYIDHAVSGGDSIE